MLDLYAGVGLFSIALAGVGHEKIAAVEGDRTSGTDLRRNAREWPAVRATISGVEEFLARHREHAETIIVDPPRTGISKEAMDAVVRHGAARIVYVSCDPATMARDARRLLDAGYRMQPLVAFDLFPNTPHVETVGVFDAVTAPPLRRRRRRRAGGTRRSARSSPGATARRRRSGRSGDSIASMTPSGAVAVATSERPSRPTDWW